MPKVKKPQTGIVRGHYYEAEKHGRGRNAEILVKVWKGETKDGDPAHEWEMPGILPMDAAISQAVLQSK